MASKSPAVDAYIAKAAPFARPILKKLRSLYHRASPQIVETIKWGVPHFESQGIVGSMAAFKQHVSIGFWKAALMSDPQGLLVGVRNTTMASLKVARLSDLPSDGTFLAYIREAIRLNAQGAKIPAKKKPARPMAIPADLLAALQRNRKAKAAFDAFSPSHQREYIEWIAEARQASTRDRRLAQTLLWLAEGKSRNWKYTKKHKS